MDFTLKKYQILIKTLIKQDYNFQTFQKFLEKPKSKSIVLRHDVDKLPENSLRFAKIQNELGIKGSYYFRIVPESFNTDIIKEIAELGHEVGYHYEDVDLAVKSMKNEKLIINNEEKIANQGIVLFEKHLTDLRKYYPIKTICMHGSPLSKYDNKLLWKYFNYKDYGLIGEPYFDVDFSKVLYLTDTGRRWDGEKVSVRDKVTVRNGEKKKQFEFKYTSDIINAVRNGELPNQIMFTFHPQRWTNNYYDWTKELVWQNAKNMIKFFLNKIR